MSEPLAPWREHAARLIVFGAPALLFLIVVSSPVGEFFAQAGAGVMERNAQRAALAPLVEKAKLWRVDYDTAKEGDYVLWCVDHPTSGYAYQEGRPSRPLVLSNDWAMRHTSPSSGGRCVDILGQVETRKPQGLGLRFIGYP